MRDSTVWEFIRICMAVFPGPKNLPVITRSPYYRGGRKAGFHCT